MKGSWGCIKSSKAFTLIELIMVVIIVSVLASIALPQYAAFKERAIVTEALNAIGAVKKAQEIRRLETGSYVDCSANIPRVIESNLGIALSAVNWSYYSNVIDPFCFAVAVRRTGPQATMFIAHRWSTKDQVGYWYGTHTNTPINRRSK